MLVPLLAGDVIPISEVPYLSVKRHRGLIKSTEDPLHMQAKNLGGGMDIFAPNN